MRADQDRQIIPHDREPATGDQLELVLLEASDADGACEDASFDSFLERFPPAARERRQPS